MRSMIVKKCAGKTRAKTPSDVAATMREVQMELRELRELCDWAIDVAIPQRSDAAELSAELLGAIRGRNTLVILRKARRSRLQWAEREAVLAVERHLKPRTTNDIDEDLDAAIMKAGPRGVESWRFPVARRETAANMCVQLFWVLREVQAYSPKRRDLMEKIVAERFVDHKPPAGSLLARCCRWLDDTSDLDREIRNSGKNPDARKRACVLVSKITGESWRTILDRYKSEKLPRL
jgi:hypothetical protein